MIGIRFQEPNTKEWRAWRNQCESEQEAHNRAIEAGESSVVKDGVYKGKKFGIKAEIYANAEGPFRGKCVYCEQKISGDQHVDIDHFRPKDGVTDIDFKPVMIEIEGETKKHPGYYWLAYEWTNLLPACILCNQILTEPSEGKLIGKHTRFPVNGSHAVDPGDEVNEDPLLINPLFDEPSDHLELHSIGAYVGKTNKGKTCIDVFGLNVRGLPNDRGKMYKDILQKMGLLSQGLAIAPNSAETLELLDEITNHKDGRFAHTAAAHKAINDAVNNQAILKDLIDEN